MPKPRRRKRPALTLQERALLREWTIWMGDNHTEERVKCREGQKQKEKEKRDKS